MSADTQAGATAAAPGVSPDRRLMRHVLQKAPQQAVLIATCVLFVVLAVSSDAFLTKTNLLNILEQNAGVGMIAIGATLVLIAGGFDLSVGAIYAITGIAAAKLTNSLGPEIALAAGVLLGAALGGVNGIVTAAGRVNPLIATLATGMAIRGLATLWTAGMFTSVSDRGFVTLGQGGVLGVKYSIWLLAIWAVLCWWLLRFTIFGRFVYAVGGNAEAARLSGVRVGLVRSGTYALGGLGAGLAGVIAASTVGNGQADAGIGIELTAIAAVVIGGTSILGGVGGIWRTVVGVLFLALVSNGLNLLSVDPSYQQIVQGLIILLAIGGDAFLRRREQ